MGRRQNLKTIQDKLSDIADHAFTFKIQSKDTELDKLEEMINESLSYAEEKLGEDSHKRSDELPGRFRIFTIEPGCDPAKSSEIWGYSFVAKNEYEARCKAVSYAHEQGKFLRDSAKPRVCSWCSVGLETHRLQLETGYLYLRRET